MFSKKIVGVVLTTGIVLSSASAMANDFRDFRVCKPYRLEVTSLNDQINNFDVEVLQPLERQLSERAARVSHRASDERKLEIVVRDIQNRISTAEGRLRSNPGAIEANKRSMVQARQEIESLEREIEGYERELEDAGWIKKKRLKAKIKKRKKEIKKEEGKIVDLQRSNERMAEEIRTLPATISANRQRLVTADANLASLRNRVPTLTTLRAEERAVRNRLDSQEDIEAGLRRELTIADREFSLCRRIEEDAFSYVALRKMVKLLKGADCNMQLVRSRLPYDVSKLELRALSDANQMVCALETPVVN